MPPLNPYPHEGCCPGCRDARTCNACGNLATPGTRCTNGRCMRCHATYCTPGGATSRGHGIGRVGLGVAHGGAK